MRGLGRQEDLGGEGYADMMKIHCLKTVTFFLKRKKKEYGKRSPRTSSCCDVVELTSG